MATETEYTTTATVTDDSPVTIIADGADTDNVAIKASDVGAIEAGDRVTVVVRNPRPCLIVAIEVEA